MTKTGFVIDLEFYLMEWGFVTYSIGLSLHFSWMNCFNAWIWIVYRHLDFLITLCARPVDCVISTEKFFSRYLTWVIFAMFTWSYLLVVDQHASRVVALLWIFIIYSYNVYIGRCSSNRWAFRSSIVRKFNPHRRHTMILFPLASWRWDKRMCSSNWKLSLKRRLQFLQFGILSVADHQFVWNEDIIVLHGHL